MTSPHSVQIGGRGFAIKSPHRPNIVGLGSGVAVAVDFPPRSMRGKKTSQVGAIGGPVGLGVHVGVASPVVSEGQKRKTEMTMSKTTTNTNASIAADKSSLTTFSIGRSQWGQGFGIFGDLDFIERSQILYGNQNIPLFPLLATDTARNRGRLRRLGRLKTLLAN